MIFTPIVEAFGSEIVTTCFNNLGMSQPCSKSNLSPVQCKPSLNHLSSKVSDDIIVQVQFNCINL